MDLLVGRAAAAVALDPQLGGVEDVQSRDLEGGRDDQYDRIDGDRLAIDVELLVEHRHGVLQRGDRERRVVGRRPVGGDDLVLVAGRVEGRMGSVRVSEELGRELLLSAHGTARHAQRDRLQAVEVVVDHRLPGERDATPVLAHPVGVAGVGEVRFRVLITLWHRRQDGRLES